MFYTQWFSIPSPPPVMYRNGSRWTRWLMVSCFHHFPPSFATKFQYFWKWGMPEPMEFNTNITSSTRTRRGGSCLKDIYKTFLIYRTCMRRAPAKPVRACTLRNWCLVSHVTFEAPRHTSHLTVFTLHTTHCTLHTPLCALHTPHFTLHTPHFTLHTSHCTLPTAHSTLHTSHSTLHTSQSTLHTSHSTLHSPHFTLHTSHWILHAPHFTLHPSHSTLHLIWALLTLSQLISSHLISSHM